MTLKQILKAAALIGFVALAPLSALAQGTGSAYPSIVLKNQFGETSINSVTGGSGQLDCNFIVDSTNGSGYGARALKGTPCKNIYMHTTVTPHVGNPNPPPGYILVVLSQNYFGYVGGYSGFVSGTSGSNVNISSGLTLSNPYVIVSVGTSTAANWQAIGLPAGITPAVGASFIATSASAGVGTGIVQAPLATGSGVLQMDVIGDANQSTTATGGAQILLRTLGATSSSVTTLVATAPADNTVIGLRFVMLPVPSALK